MVYMIWFQIWYPLMSYDVCTYFSYIYIYIICIFWKCCFEQSVKTCHRCSCWFPHWKPSTVALCTILIGHLGFQVSTGAGFLPSTVVCAFFFLIGSTLQLLVPFRSHVVCQQSVVFAPGYTQAPRCSVQAWVSVVDLVLSVSNLALPRNRGYVPKCQFFLRKYR